MLVFLVVDVPNESDFLDKIVTNLTVSFGYIIL